MADAAAREVNEVNEVNAVFMKRLRIVVRLTA